MLLILILKYLCLFKFLFYSYFKLEKENEIQKQLIEHMLSSRERINEMPTSMTTSSDRDIRSVVSSTSSSRSTSPSDMA
jgi:hypothetical protein